MSSDDTSRTNSSGVGVKSSCAWDSSSNEPMPSHVIEVAFKGNRREFFLWETDDIPVMNAAVIVEADRGEDLGRVHSIGTAALQRNAGVPHGTGDTPPTKRA